MAASEKIDLYKLHKDQYAAPRKPVILKIDPASYLSIEGRGEPASASRSAATICSSVNLFFFKVVLLP